MSRGVQFQSELEIGLIAIINFAFQHTDDRIHPRSDTYYDLAEFDDYCWHFEIPYITSDREVCSKYQGANSGV